MNKDKYVFAQLVEFLDCFKFRRIVAKYNGYRYVKHLTCWNQFLSMMFGQLANRESLRGLIVALDIKVHTLYDVETQIPTFFHITSASTHDSKAMSEISYETGSYYIFDRAYNKFSQLFSINQIGAYFVVRAKKNLQCKTIKWKRRLPKNVLSDCTVELTNYKSSNDYPKQLRFVRYYDAEQDIEFVFLTNATHISSLVVAKLYKNRWQIELFLSGSSSISR